MSDLSKTFDTSTTQGILDAKRQIMGDDAYNNQIKNFYGDINPNIDVNRKSTDTSGGKGNAVASGVFQAVDMTGQALSAIGDMYDTRRNLQSAIGYAEGGMLGTNGANFSNGLTYINEGGTHEENPYEGVLQGVDSQGTPNLVEEGETIYNDYVFSNRLTVPNLFKKKYKLGGSKKLSYADASKKMARESEERPNDPISKRGLDASLAALRDSQEETRFKKMSPEEQMQVLQQQYGLEGGMNAQQDIPMEDMPQETMMAYGGNKSTANIFATAGDIDRGYTPTAEELKSADFYKKIYDLNARYRKNREYLLAHQNDNYVKNWLSQKGLTIQDIIQKGLDGLDANNNYNPGGGWGKIHAAINDFNISDEALASVVSSVKDPKITIKPARDKRKRYYKTTYNANGVPTNTLIENYGEDWANANPNYRYFKTDSTTEGNTDYTNYYLQESPKTGHRSGLFSAENERYAPVLGAFSALMNASRPADYSNADRLAGEAALAGNYGPIGWNPIPDLFTYKPFDRLAAFNELRAQAAGQRRQIINNSGMNRGQVTAGLLAQGYNEDIGLGKAFLQGEQGNQAQRTDIAARRTDVAKANSTGLLQANSANQSAYNQALARRMQGMSTALSLREQIGQARANAMATASNNVYDNIGNVAIDKLNRRDRDMLIKSGVFGTLSQKPSGWTNDEWATYKNNILTRMT